MFKMHLKIKTNKIKVSLQKTLRHKYHSPRNTHASFDESRNNTILLLWQKVERSEGI